jgi:hypothetical protein
MSERTLVAYGKTGDLKPGYSMIYFDYTAIDEGTWSPGFKGDGVSETLTERDPKDVAAEEFQYDLFHEEQTDNEREDEQDV